MPQDLPLGAPSCSSLSVLSACSPAPGHGPDQSTEDMERGVYSFQSTNSTSHQGGPDRVFWAFWPWGRDRGLAQGGPLGSTCPRVSVQALDCYGLTKRGWGQGLSLAALPTALSSHSIYMCCPRTMASMPCHSQTLRPRSSRAELSQQR